MSGLRTEQLCVALGSRNLISNLDWTVETGQLWCVLGPNGVGKTSLLYALAGLLPPVSGLVRIGNDDIAELSDQMLARKRGMLRQHQVDAFSSSVLAAVSIGRTPYRAGAGWDAARDRAIALDALTAVGLRDSTERDITRLSGGERQRVALAALLAQNPGVMLLDEPTAHQDVAQQLHIMSLMRKLSADHAVVASCHDINLAARFATHALVLAPQRHWLGTVEEVLTPEVLEAAFGCSFRKTAFDGGYQFFAQIVKNFSNSDIIC